MKKVIDSFSGEYRFLSNFWYSDFIFRFPKVGYCKVKTVEHAFQAYKSLSPKKIKEILSANTPQRAKSLGRSCKVRKDWEDIKLNIMYQLVKKKFQKNYQLRERLVATGNAKLIKGNNWKDTYWGVYKGEGENMLGKILMKVRKELR